MERFSGFRDPATGIQPFLPLVPPTEHGSFALFLIPIRIVLASLRTLAVVIIVLLYCALEDGLYVLIMPIPPLRRSLSRFGTRCLARIVLFVLGFVQIQEELVAKKRGYIFQIVSENTTSGRKPNDSSWHPQAGDIILSNWTSWIDVLWMAYRFNPVFVMPVIAKQECKIPTVDSSPMMHKPGRNGRFSSPVALHQASKIYSSLSIRGFRRVSLLEMIRISGRTPEGLQSNAESSLEELRQSVHHHPIVVFPECTTSNGRGILRFANIFEGFTLPVERFNVFIMCVRHDSPTSRRSSPSFPVPSLSLNPLQHLFFLSKSISLQHMTIRMLPLSESPSSQLFKVDEIVSDPSTNLFAQVCATLMARIGRMKRLSFGWEEKIAFLEFYRHP